jgi:hypothetical protein
MVVLPELDQPVEDVARQVPDRAFLGVCPGAQQRQRLGQAHSGADGDHPGCLVHLRPVVQDGQGVRWRDPLGGVLGLQVQQEVGAASVNDSASVSSPWESTPAVSR